MISLKNIVTARRLTFSILLFCLFSLAALTAPLRQDEEGKERRLWDKKFLEARDKAKKQTPVKPPVKPFKKETSPHANSTTRPAPETFTAQPPQAALDTIDPAVGGELIGITIWRLRYATKNDDPGGPRLLVQKSGASASPSSTSTQSAELLAERVSADTPFSEGQMLRLGLEVPRQGASYIYVIDREVYADSSRSDPYLIFPAKSTPRGDEVGSAGKIIYIPSWNDPIPYFSLQRSRADQVSEQLTIIISPHPLDLNPGDGPLKLDPAQVAQWEKEWGGATERREAVDGAGRGWTAAEKEAGEGERRLVQGDPLPQTIYRVKTNPGKPVLVTAPLRIAP
jgi:hypothetical protein